MEKTFYESLLNSIIDPVLVADTNHIVQYMNKAAEKHYEEGDSLMGSNLLFCHNEESQKMMIDILEKMQNELEEELITDNEKFRIFMRAVRDESGKLIGYFERYESPTKK